ncbi:MAG: hypothetical protein AVDCRST_MAG50-770, partial [uncultured Acidimicrobiales bacterium]
EIPRRCHPRLRSWLLPGRDGGPPALRAAEPHRPEGQAFGDLRRGHRQGEGRGRPGCRAGQGLRGDARSVDREHQQWQRQRHLQRRRHGRRGRPAHRPARAPL